MARDPIRGGNERARRITEGLEAAQCDIQRLRHSEFVSLKRRRKNSEIDNFLDFVTANRTPNQENIPDALRLYLADEFLAPLDDTFKPM